MGEEPWRVHVVGAPSLDQMAKETLLPQHQLEEQLQAKLVPAPILVAYHPVTLDTFPAADVHRPVRSFDPNRTTGLVLLSERRPPLLDHFATSAKVLQRTSILQTIR